MNVKIKLNLKPKRAISFYVGKAIGATTKQLKKSQTEFRKGMKEASNA